MNKLFIFLFACIFLTGCFTIQPSVDMTPFVDEEEPEVFRLSQEKIQVVDGVSYIIVTFPSQSEDYDSFLDDDTGEYVVIRTLPSR